ncbi:MAG: protease family protein [Alphaproteobacteria bacterium]|nr:protease family protein [Alphaproteobacteria bacterium]
MSFSTDQNPTPFAVPPWGIPATIAWLLFAFLVSIVAATGVFAAWQADRANLSNFSYDGVVITIGTLASVPAQLAVLAFAARLRHWSPQDYFALSIPKRSEVVFAMLCIAALVVVFDAMTYLSGRDLVPSFQIDAYQSAKEAGWLIWLMLAIVMVAPVGEEIAFRGFLYRGLVRPGREMLAIVVISLAWAFLHIQYDWLGMAQIFAAGLMLGWFRWASGSTMLTIVMHVVINAEAMLETAMKVELLS